MATGTYLLTAVLAFFVVIGGSDLIARMTIAGDTFRDAFGEHLRFLWSIPFGLILMFAPFGGTAVLCGLANKRSKTRSAVVLFFVSLIVLAYFYFDGFQASQQALLDERWTAATLSIGLLPVFIGVPVLALVAIAAAVIARVDRRQTATL